MIFFESIYKIIMLLFVLPLFRKALLSVYSVPGDLTNLNLEVDLFTFPGICMCILILGLIVVLAAFELTVLELIIWKNTWNISLTLFDIMDFSLERTGEMMRLKNAGGLFYLLLLLPLAHTGIILTIPPEMSVYSLIQAFFVQIEHMEIPLYVKYIAQFLNVGFICFNFYLLFIPALMIIKNLSFGEAVKENKHLIKSLFRENGKKFKRFSLIYFLSAAAGEILAMTRSRVLYSGDLSFNVLRYMMDSSYFREDLFYFICVTLMKIVMMACVLWCGEAALQNTAFFRREDIRLPSGYHSRDQNTDARKLRHFFPKRIRKFFSSPAVRYDVLFIIILLFVGGMIGFTREYPLLHRPWVIGHRGSTEAVENTAAAYTGAYREGADLGELDVRFTKDKKLVVFHDETLKRLAGINKKVSDMTLDELKQVILKQRGMEAHINTLDEIIEQVKKDSDTMMLLIELKVEDGDSDSLADSVVEAVEKEDFGKRAIFMSFDPEAVERIHEKRPDWWAGYCAYGIGDKLTESTWNYGFDFLALKRNEISYQLIADARDHHVPVYVWTVGSPEEAKYLYSIGVEGVISNYPDKIVKARAELEEEEPIESIYSGNGYPVKDDYFKHENITSE